MRNTTWLTLVAGLVSTSVFALQPTASENRAIRDWGKKVFGDTKELPLSFKYDGRSFPDASWRKSVEKSCIVYRDPSDQLEARIELKVYEGSPVMSWLLSFRNLSDKNTKIISEVRPFDFRVPVKSKDKYHVVHHAAGAMQSLNDYQQFSTVISQDWWRDHRLHLETRGGRSCESCWPYFNVETPDAKAGMIAAIGWSGQWQADFDAMGDDAVKMTAGMTDCRFYLKPGECVRGPRAIVLLYRRENWVEGQNLWRQWFLRHNAPKVDGEVVPYQTMCSYAQSGFDSDNWSATSQRKCIDAYASHGFQIDYWWIDAAWYNWKNQWNDPEKKEPHWRWTGDYDADPVRFPNGPGESFEYARRHIGAKDGILWFELERVVPSARIYQAHPEYFYADNTGRGFFLDLGNPGALEWGIKTANKVLRREKTDYFRLDFNFPCLYFWRRNDARNGEQNRCGISEMKHVENFYRLYEAVLKDNPKKRRIDNCAQGGCRNDVEALSYAAPLWRTDTSNPIDEQQMQTLGISLWVPLYGGGCPSSTDVYELRSRLMPYLHVGTNIERGDMSWKNLKENYELWKRVREYYVKDFYPLTRSDKENDIWCGWEFVDPEAGSGFVQLFRRAEARSPSFCVKPCGLDPSKRYVFEDVDTRQKWVIHGDGAFEVRCENARSAKVILFRESKGESVPVISDAMRDFIGRPYHERVGLLQDQEFRIRAKRSGSCPRSYEFSVTNADDKTIVEFVKKSSMEVVRRISVNGGKAKIDNLEVACDYLWRAVRGGMTVAEGSFRTEDGVPRICRIDGIGNVRDLGGRRTKDGCRIRQGLVYRSATFNMTAYTPKDKKDQWRPGKVLLAANAAQEAIETFGFKTDLDFRTDEETYQMTASPLGKNVKWVHVPSSNYLDMINPVPAAAFAKDFRMLLDKDNLPLVFHCVSGADRTGTFGWLLGGILGMSEADLWQDWELSIFHYDAVKFNHYNCIGTLLRWLAEKYPRMTMQERCVAYAKDVAGITDEEIECFRAIMLEPVKESDKFSGR